jgi:TrmH family RNA methyltransferase
VIELMVLDDSVDRHRELLKIAYSLGVRNRVSRRLGPIAQLAETVTPQGLVAVCQMIDVPAIEALGNQRDSWCCVIRFVIQATSAR